MKTKNLIALYLGIYTALVLILALIFQSFDFQAGYFGLLIVTGFIMIPIVENYG